MSRAGSIVLVLAVVVAGCSGEAGSRDGCCATSSTSGGSATSAATPSGAPVLEGKVVVLDPGHQLGNRNFASETNAPVDAGGFEKPCNTTGTATAAGFPEATFTWRVAVETRRILRRLGAQVILTRSANSADGWGPCIDERGRIGNPRQPGPTADVRLSIHADGVSRGSTTGGRARGFHVVRPGGLPGWTDDIEHTSRPLARLLRDALVAEGFTTSTYTGVRGIDVRDDLGTLNLSDVPAVLVELGNMRDPGEARVMERPTGQRRYARALAAAVRAYLEG